MLLIISKQPGEAMALSPFQGTYSHIIIITKCCAQSTGIVIYHEILMFLFMVHIFQQVRFWKFKRHGDILSNKETREWNLLPPELRSISNINAFKSKLDEINVEELVKKAHFKI